MEIKNYFTETEAIQISVVKIGTKKMTKSLFDQLDYFNPFDADWQFIGDKVLGFYKIQDEFIMVGIKNNNLFKLKFNYMLSIGRIEVEDSFAYSNKSHHFEKMLGIDYIRNNYKEYFADSDEEYLNKYLKISEVINNDGLKKLKLITKNITSFTPELMKHRCYL